MKQRGNVVAPILMIITLGLFVVLSGALPELTYAQAATPPRQTLEPTDDATSASRSLIISNTGKITDAIIKVVWSPDGKTLAAVQYETVWLVDVSTMKLLPTRIGLHGWLMCLAWSPDGKMLAYGGAGTALQLSAADGSLIRVLGQEPPNKYIDNNGIYSVAWSPDGKMLAASGGIVGHLRIWDATSWQLKHNISMTTNSLSNRNNYVTGLAWSPDSRILASNSSDHAVRLWDALTGELLHTFLQNGDSFFATGLAWSPDGKILAATDYYDIQLWDVTSGQNIRTLSGHTGEVYSVAWSPDGKTLASGSGDYTSGGTNMMRLWDVTTGQSLRVVKGLTSNIYSVAWSPDGKTLASGGVDGTLRLWDMSDSR